MEAIKCSDEQAQISVHPRGVSGLRELPYWSHYSKPRLLLHTVVCSKYFDLSIAGVIGLNVITMALEFYMMPQELQFALKIFNFFFTSVFILEAIVKIIALGLLRYLHDRWNQLDIAIVFLSITGIILEEMKSGVIPINPTIIRVMRVLRIARVLKLLKMAKSVRALLDTVVQALPEVGNLGLLFFLLFFIFAALGVELFGRVECSEQHPCEGLNKHAHFRNFGMAFLTLFRVATGDNWNGIMKDTLREDCDMSDDCIRNCCVSTIIAPVFFVIFVLMAQFVLVNVVVAVLMKHLEDGRRYLVEENMRGEGGEDQTQEGETEGKESETTPDNFALENFGDKDHDKVLLVCNEVIYLQESHKHMDDEVDLETEIQREFDEEERLRNGRKMQYQQYFQDETMRVGGAFDGRMPILISGERELRNGKRVDLDVRTLLKSRFLGCKHPGKRLSLPANFTFSKSLLRDNTVVDVCSDEPLDRSDEVIVLHGDDDNRRDSESQEYQQTIQDGATCYRLGQGTSFPTLCSSDKPKVTPFTQSFHLSVPHIPNAPQKRTYLPKPGPPWPWPLNVARTMFEPISNGCDKTANSHSLWRNLSGFESQQCIDPPLLLQIAPFPAHRSCTDIIFRDPENHVFSLQDRLYRFDYSPADSCNCSTPAGLNNPVGEQRQVPLGHNGLYTNYRLRTLLKNARQRLSSSFPDITLKHQKAPLLLNRQNDRYLTEEKYNNNANDRSVDRKQLLDGIQCSTCSLGQLPELQPTALHPLSKELLTEQFDQPEKLRGAQYNVSSENLTDICDDQVSVARIPEVDGDSIVSTSRETLAGVDAEDDAVRANTSDVCSEVSRKHFTEHSGHCKHLTVGCSSDAISSQSKLPTPSCNNITESENVIVHAAGDIK